MTHSTLATGARDTGNGPTEQPVALAMERMHEGGYREAAAESPVEPLPIESSRVGRPLRVRMPLFELGGGTPRRWPRMARVSFALLVASSSLLWAARHEPRPHLDQDRCLEHGS